MSKCKYYKQQKYVSDDGGFTWMALDVYRKGGLIEYESSDCTPTPPSPTGYSSQYLTFVTEEDVVFSADFARGNDVIYYSLDSGTTWSELHDNMSTPTVSANTTVMWKATLEPINWSYVVNFNSNGQFHVEGNTMSLLYGDDFIDQTSLYGYHSIFTNLFGGCSGLTSVENMVLPATTLANNCYSSMFYGCTSLTTAPQLLATTLTDYCYDYMFKGCTSLTTAPQLPSTTLAVACYSHMFDGCTSLTTAPTLSSTTLADNCYEHMFEGCTSLTEAPTLSATTLTEGCYLGMFSGCTSLSAITCLATSISATNCTYQWVSGVTSNGTFTKNPSMSSWSIGESGIPSGWTVKDYGIEYRTISGTPYCSGSSGYDKYINVYSQVSHDSGGTWITTATTPTLLEANSEDCGYVPQTDYTKQYFTLVAQDNGTISYDYDGYYSLDSGSTWTWFVNGVTLNVTSGDCIMWKYQGSCGQFSSTCNFYAEGNAMSLVYEDNFSGQTAISVSMDSLFYNCTGLTSAENMELPATGLANSAYTYMFEGCTSLTKAPILRAETLSSGCYYHMFYGCSSLSAITCLATDMSATRCTAQWVNGVAASGTFTKAASADWSVKTGNHGIPSGWTVVDAT